jgi:ribonuclease HI
VAEQEGPTVVYTDGSCLGNPGPGGWAWAVVDGPFASGADQRTTNQRMEITAVLEALRRLLPGTGPNGVEVHSDSTYVVNCFLQRWWEGWLRRGWKNSQGKPVANRDLWEPLLALALDGEHEVRFFWVKGHSGDHWNDVADELATAAAASGTGSAGTGVAAG